MYRININPEGADVIHAEHPHEECNFDDAQDRDFVDHDVALQRIAERSAVCCQHCLEDGIVE